MCDSISTKLKLNSPNNNLTCLVDSINLEKKTLLSIYDIALNLKRLTNNSQLFNYNKNIDLLKMVALSQPNYNLSQQNLSQSESTNQNNLYIIYSNLFQV